MTATITPRGHLSELDEAVAEVAALETLHTGLLGGTIAAFEWNEELTDQSAWTQQQQAIEESGQALDDAHKRLAELRSRTTGEN